MIAEILNLGPIRKAVVDMQKPFVLFCGPNSTGKTYLSYLLYAINEYSDYVDSKGLDKIAKYISTEQQFTLRRDMVDEYINDFAKSVKTKLGSIFGIGDSTIEKLFERFEMSLSITDDDFNRIISQPCRLVSGNNDAGVVLDKEKSSDIIRYQTNLKVPNLVRDSLMSLRIMLNHYFRLLCFGNMGGVRMLTVERNSIYTFKTELSISRNELIDRIQQKNDHSELDIFGMVSSSSRRYPLAVRDSLRIANDLDNVQKINGPYYEFAEQIETGILHGEVKINRNGDVEFVPENANRSRHLPIHMASSIVKTMSSLVIYLKHIARRGDLLIIDEPEMNFHPDAQISLIRLFSMLSKMDLRLIISTHSDYMIREINNMIMASSLNLSDPELVSSMGYNKDMLLRKEDIAVKYFNYGRSKRFLDVIDIKVDTDGFAVESIDNTINDQNRITETLYDRLQEINV